jgi:hypothetical protein
VTSAFRFTDTSRGAGTWPSKARSTWITSDSLGPILIEIQQNDLTTPFDIVARFRQNRRSSSPSVFSATTGAS